MNLMRFLTAALTLPLCLSVAGAQEFTVAQSNVFNAQNKKVAFNPKTQLFTSAIIGDTGPADNLGVAIIPGSRLFRVAKPYTAENISQRLDGWRTEAGFTTPEKLIEMMKSFQQRLN